MIGDPPVKMKGDTAHSLYTTNDRGVNEVALKEISRRIIVRWIMKVRHASVQMRSEKPVSRIFALE
jgi:hypothetical protein